MDKWMEFAKIQKEMWIAFSDNKDMPPCVIVHRKGEAKFIVVSPEVDKMLALKSAALCRQAMDCDAFTFVSEICGLASKDFESMDDACAARDKIIDKYGSLQKALLHKVPGIMEGLVVVHHDGKNPVMSMIEFSVDGKKVVWGEGGDYSAGGGFIVDSLGEILETPSVLKTEKLKELADSLELNEDRQIYHATRAATKILRKDQYLVLECFDWKEEDGKEKLFSKMAEAYKKGITAYIGKAKNTPFNLNPTGWNPSMN